MTPPQKLQAHTPHGPPQTLTLGKEIGRGGEGTVHLLPAPHQKFVAKIYHPGQGNENKIKAMLTTPPQSTAVAWPQQILYNDRNEFIGYTMPLLNQTTFRPWLEFAHTQQRRKTAPSFDVKYALTTALNLGHAITSLHDAGHIIGDLNESNIFVRQDTHVYLIDTDSAQITAHNQTFPCEVGKPEYTAPELVNKPFKTTTRTPATDAYAYTILIFQILTGGAHPTDGKWATNPPTVTQRIQTNTYPTLLPTPEAHPLDRIAADAIPTTLRKALIRGLNPNPQNRATIHHLTTTLTQILARLQQCTTTPAHWWDKQDQHCLWCARGNKPDPWASKPKTSRTPQITLPKVPFQQPQPTPTRARRQPIQQPQPTYQPQNPHPHITRNTHTPPATPQPTKPGLLKPRTQVIDSHGQTRPRPALPTLFVTNPKLGFQSVRNEWPNWANPIWPKHHTIKPLTAFTGTILTLLATIPTLAGLYASHYILTWPTPITLALTATLGTSAILTALTLIATSLTRIRATGHNPKPHTYLSYAATPLYWGPYLWAAIIYLLIATSYTRIRLEKAGYY